MDYAEALERLKKSEIGRHPAPPKPPKVSSGGFGSTHREAVLKNSFLSRAANAVDLPVADLAAALEGEDLDALTADELQSFAQMVAQRRLMERGEVPTHFNQVAHCRSCGPVWLWFSGEVLGCPWCWNRVAGKPIPRPCSVHCGQCSHFERIDHPHLGHCTKGEPEAIAGLWDTDRRDCARWLPLEPTPGGPKDDE